MRGYMSDITLRRRINWSSASETDIGCVREINEDALLCREDLGLWAIADGMGGYAAGDIASSIVIESLLELGSESEISTFIDNVEDKLIDANNVIQTYSKQYCNSNIIGSTAVCLIIRGLLGACLWVGDSRLYRLRNNRLKQLTVDHSKVEELVGQGVIDRNEANNHPESHVITRAIGVNEELFVSINVFTTQIGDTFMLCSDGLHNTSTDQNISECLANNNIQESASELINIAIKNNADDNVSCVIIRGEPERLATTKHQLIERVW